MQLQSRLKAISALRLLLFICCVGYAVFHFDAPTFAEGIHIDLGDTNSASSSGFTSRILQMIALVTILSLAPAILIMVTSFTRIVVVFSLVRSAIGLQQTPPNTVLTSLALFLTFFIMSPTLQQAYQNGLAPLIKNEITEIEAWEGVKKPFHAFMMQNVQEKELGLFVDIAKASSKNVILKDKVPLHALIPAFMISELKRAFEIGFLLFLPFLIIDVLISSILMAMGMMMLPPVMISLPFKIIFFVMIDGWYLLCGSLVKSYGIG